MASPETRTARIIVSSRRAIEDGSVRPGQFDAVISINNEGVAAPAAVRDHPNALVLEFQDIFLELLDTGGGRPPTVEDVRKIVRFATENCPSRMLLHCNAGISRSGAAACIVQAAWAAASGRVDPDPIEELIATFHLFPNDLMLRLADEVLTLQPTLSELVDPIVRRRWGWR